MLSPRKKPRTTPKLRKTKLARLNRLLRQHERLWERGVKPQFRRVMMRVTSRIEGAGPTGLAEMEQRFAQDLADVHARLYRATMYAFKDQVVEDVKSAGRVERKDFLDIFESGVRTWIATHALRRAQTIASNLFADVRNELENSYAEGLGNAAAARRIRQTVGEAYAVWKAQRLARTEAHTASSVGMEEAVRSTGLEMDREWMAAEDQRTRISHALADGQVVGMEEPFQVGGTSLMYPGDPAGPASEVINCRCVLAYHPR